MTIYYSRVIHAFISDLFNGHVSLVSLVLVKELKRHVTTMNS